MSPTKAKAPSAEVTPATATSAPPPTITPGEATALVAAKVDGTGPQLQPPGAALAQSAAAGVSVMSSATIGALYTSNNVMNAWVYLNAIGWRRISPANQSGHQSILEIARLARDAGVAVQCDDDGSVIHNIYMW
jgi:hypothetical protein